MKDVFTINVKLSVVTKRLAALIAYTQPIQIKTYFRLQQRTLLIFAHIAPLDYFVHTTQNSVFVVARINNQLCTPNSHPWKRVFSETERTNLDNEQKSGRKWLMHARLKTFSGGKFLLHRRESLHCGEYLRTVGPTYRRKRNSGLEKGSPPNTAIYNFYRCTMHFEIYVVHSPTNALFINLVKSFKFTLKYTTISLLHVSVFNDHHQGALSVPN